MKITVFLLVMAIMSASAGTFAQKITLSEKNASLENVLNKIRTQSGYGFLYSSKLIKTSKPVSIQVKNVALEEVLKKIFADQPLTYEMEDKAVLISEKPLSIVDRITGFFQQDSVIFKGRVLDAFGEPLAGASVKVKGSKKSTFTTREGNFAIFARYDAVLQVSYVGYETEQLQLRREDSGILIKFNMKLAEQSLTEVAVVSTGYQELPKERATGSFEVVTAKQLELSTNQNLLKRLEGLTTSMDFNNNLFNSLTLGEPRRSAISGVTIRGKNTLNIGLAQGKFESSGNILVVIDGIATPYAIEDVNPNDVESVTILKDAASASIWGSRAANGVIVIKSKKGKFNSPTSVSFTSNLSVSDKVDFFYKKRMSISEYIDFQVLFYKDLFEANGDLPVDDPDLFQPQQPMSPVAEILNEEKMGRLSPERAKAMIDDLRKNDIRRDYNKYLLRNPFIQNYTLGLSGGTKNYSYRLSGGYDRSLTQAVTDESNRYSLNYSTTIQPLKNLEVNTIVGYIQSNNITQPSETIVQGFMNSGGYYPYVRLADDQGNALPIYPDFRKAFLDTLASNYGEKILDMSYKPLEDMRLNYSKLKNQGLNLNLNTNYKISEVFSASVTYSYNWGLSEQKILNHEKSYFMRQLINKFTNPAKIPDDNPEDPLNLYVPFEKQIPLGGRYRYIPTKTNTQTLIGLINVNKTWNTKHVLSAIAGAEIAQDYGETNGVEYYGYNENGSRKNINLPFGKYIYNLYRDKDVGSNNEPLPALDPTLSNYKIRTFSYYTNAAYTFDRRYTLSGSIRKDASSLFGNEYNTGGTPFFSVGGLWNINNESFYKLSWLPSLQLKATFGNNGNTNARFTSVPSIGFGQGSPNSLPFASVSQGSNPELRPEKSYILNLGLHFGSKNNRLSGSVEYYNRKTIDMIATGPLDPTTGFKDMSYNIGNLRSTGIDVSLHSLNIQSGLFKWTSDFLFSNNKVKVTKLFTATPPTANGLVINSPSYNEGAELSRLYAWRWAGLDPETGDPRGYLNGEAVRITGATPELAAIAKGPMSGIKLFGSSVPVYYGSFRNTFSYQNFSVSANFLYKLGYYFRPPTTEFALSYRLIKTNQLLAGEYANRWQKPGDEKITNVPSLSYSGSSDRDLFYYYSEINVLKADHIRLQQINLSYTINTRSRFIKNPRISGNVSNLGIVWRANKKGFDPDVRDYPQPRTYNIGFSANF